MASLRVMVLIWNPSSKFAGNDWIKFIIEAYSSTWWALMPMVRSAVDAKKLFNLSGCIAIRCELGCRIRWITHFFLVSYMTTLLRLLKQKIYISNPFRIRIFLFLSCSFGIEKINKFTHSRSFLEKHTRFQTKMGKVYTRFHTKTQKPYPFGQHIPMWLI